MYKLSSTQKIQVKLGAAVTANELPLVSTAVQLTDAGFPMAAITPVLTVSNGVTAVDMAVGVASASVVLKSLTIYNADTANANVTVQAYNSTGPVTDTLIIKDLGPGDVLHYEDGEGWQVHRKRERTLADGQVANTPTLVYTSTGQKSFGLYLFNTNTTAEVVTVQIQRSGGTARTFRQVTLQASESYELRRIMLSPADVLLLGTTTASKVNYLVFRDPLTEE